MQVRVLFVPVGIRTGKEAEKKKCLVHNQQLFLTQAHCNNVLEVAFSELSAVLHRELVVNTIIYVDTILLLILWKFG